jgi:hypothetical protein
VEFAQQMRQARSDAGHTLAAQVLEISDEVCADGVDVQRNRLRVDSRKWAAAKMNAAYADRMAIGGANDLPPLQVDQLSGAKAIAFVLARAGHLLAKTPKPPVPAPPAISRMPLERRPAFRRIMAEVEPPVDHDRDEDDAALSRIGDPDRKTSEPDAGRKALSARRSQS